MIDVRSQCYPGSHLSSLWNAFSNRKRVCFAQAVANWLHNLAFYSALDFEGFQEDWFWMEYAEFRQEFPANRWPLMTQRTIEELQK
ncbi:hypothetical protein [Hymenobacter psychrophilus]|uniref:hypothetical protein n=1 Tax=Hymenobacter psychrophilus TaxID=651662 RepID=UPI001114CD2E|nr:hypothetical protein [Hymenobacter psychrophilus]